MPDKENGLAQTTAQEFKRITGWDKRTSTHSRDAVMLIWGLRNVA